MSASGNCPPGTGVAASQCTVCIERSSAEQDNGSEAENVCKTSAEQKWFLFDVLGTDQDRAQVSGSLLVLDPDARPLARSTFSGPSTPAVVDFGVQAQRAVILPRETDFRLMLDLDGYRIPMGYANLPGYSNLENDFPSLVHHHTLFAPLLLSRYTSPTLSPGYTAPLAANSYIYVFLEGHLWRELKAGSDGATWQDINLGTEYGKKERVASGQSLRHLTIPVKLGRKSCSLEIAFSAVQWTWERVLEMGDLHPEDPRRKRGAREVKPDTDKRAARLSRIDTKTLERPNLLSERVEWWCLPRQANDRADLRAYRDSRLPLLLVEDPVVIAGQFKERQATALNLVEMLAEEMRHGEYPLAMLIQSLQDSAVENAKAAEERHADAKTVAPTFTDIAKEGRQKGKRLQEKIADQITGYQERAEAEEWTPQEKLQFDVAYNTVQWDFLEKTIEKWQSHDRELSQYLAEESNALIDYMERKKDDPRRVTFGSVLEDYFAHGTSAETFAQGNRILFSLLDGMYCKKARNYVDWLFDEHTLGKYLFHPTPLQAKYLIDLETDESADDAFYPPPDLFAVGVKGGKTATKVFRYMVNGLAAADLSESRLQRLVMFIQAYAPEFKAKVENLPLDALHKIQPLGSPLYRFVPSLSPGAAKIKIPVIVPQGLHVNDYKNSKAHRVGFHSLWGVVEFINLAQAYGKLIENGSGRDAAKAGVAVADVTGFLANVVELLRSPEKQKEAAAAMTMAVKRPKVQELLAVARFTRGNASTRPWKQLVESVGSDIKKWEFAGKTSRFCGLVSAAGTTAIGAWDVVRSAREGNRLGVLGGSINFAGGLSTIIGTVQFNRWSRARKVVSAAIGVARATQVAGTAASGTVIGIPEGLAAIVIGTLLGFVGETILQFAFREELIKLLRYGYFGQDPYDWWQNPYDAERNFDSELNKIHRNIYDFDASVQIYDAGKGFAIREVVRGTLLFSRFLPGQTLVDAKFYLHYENDATTYIVALAQMRIRQVLTENGDGLMALHLYYGDPLHNRFIKSVEFTATLDVFGDGQVVIEHKAKYGLPGRLPMGPIPRYFPIKETEWAQAHEYGKLVK